MLHRLLAISAIGLLAGCGKPVAVSEDIRPVRVIAVQGSAGKAVAEFAGEVRPRVETRAGFQIGGRITRRLVEVGQTVKSGQPLATVDPQDYRLSEQSAQAALAAAAVERNQQRADYKRFEELQTKGFISAADLERRKATLDAAEARYLQAEASARAMTNQSEYAVLRAPHDAVVTAIDAEVGQVVAAGQSIVRLASTGEKEVAIAIPEQQLQLLRAAREIQVRLWSGGDPIKGNLRELSPVADSATRTFPARISLVDPPAAVALGMTASVRFEVPLAASDLVLPTQTLLHEGGKTQVWVFDPASNTVRRVFVEVGNVAGNDVVITQGVKAGDLVVSAGVHQLKDGQKVKRLGDAETLSPLPLPATVKPEKKV
jgi:RND family efflux transporter MFP subunit